MELVLADPNSDTIPSSGEVARTVKYFVIDRATDPSPDDVLDFLNDELPRSLSSGLILSSFSPVRVSPGFYEVDVEYGLTSRRITGVTPLEETTGENSYAFSFSTSGGTYHVKTAKEQTAYGTTPEDVDEAINWNGQAAEGIDIVGGKLQFEIRKKKPGNLITLNYLRVLYGLTGKTNNAAYLGFAAGELLFLGANGQQVRGGDTEVTFQFVANPNLASATIAGVTVSDIKGHDYVWSYYQPGTLGVPTLKGVYKARLYDSGNFNLLGAT